MPDAESTKGRSLSDSQRTSIDEFLHLVSVSPDSALLGKVWKKLFVSFFRDGKNKLGELEDGLEFEIELVNIIVLDKPSQECFLKIQEYVIAKDLGPTIQSALSTLKNLIILKHGEFIDNQYFDYFFAFRLSKKPAKRVFDFLRYHLHHSFNSDVSRFSNYLKYSILLDYDSQFDDHCREIIQDFIKSDASQTKMTELSTRQAAIILHIKLQTKELSYKGAKTRFLQNQAAKLKKGKVAFPRAFLKVEKDFKERPSKLREELGVILPLLSTESKNWLKKVLESF